MDFERNETRNCYSDHAANSSCQTNQFCYAEWRLDNYDQLVSQSQATNRVDISQIRLDKAFNCYNGKYEHWLNGGICQATPTNVSHVIRRCCNQSDYCNKLPEALPVEEDARRAFFNMLSANLAQTSSTAHRLNITDQYSGLPPTVQMVVILVCLSILCFAAVVVQKYRARRAGSATSLTSTGGSRYQCSIKKVLNDVLTKIGVRRNMRDAHLPAESSPNNSEPRFARDHDDDRGETPGLGNYDTNSMASREPLIRGLNRLQRMTPGDRIHLFQNQPNVEDTRDSRPCPSLEVNLSAGIVGSDDQTSSGSGKGQPYLTHRSVSHDIQLKQIIGRGYYSVVWRGEFKGQPVAVKIFRQHFEASWERETEIYQTAMLRHKNILGLIAIDKRLDSPSAGLWLVTDFYPMGSLYDFLSSNIITMLDAVRMAFSIANGLSHLHVEIFGIRAKPAIAHRDMKSKNILVKNDGTCCIADLGMAVRYSSDNGILDEPTNARMGTRRYLAPEILEDRLNLHDFEGVKATDIYALGLVFWEILRRTCLIAVDQTDSPSISEGQTMDHSEASLDELNELAFAVDEFQVPFYEDVSIDPSTDEMYEVVCVRKIRPRISPRWLEFASMRDYVQLMTECWYEKPQARLSALRVGKSLSDIATKYFNLNIMELD